METTNPIRGGAVPSGACALLTTVMPFGVPALRATGVLGGLRGSAPITGPFLASDDRRHDVSGFRRHDVSGARLRGTAHRATPLLIDDSPTGESLRAYAPAGPAAPPDRRSTHPGDHT